MLNLRAGLGLGQIIVTLKARAPTPPPGERLITAIIDGSPKYVTAIIDGKKYYLTAPVS